MHLWLNTEKYGKILSFFSFKHPNSKNLNCRFRVEDENAPYKFAGEMDRVKGYWMPKQDNESRIDSEIFEDLINIIVQYFIDNPYFETEIIILDKKRELIRLRQEELDIRNRLHSVFCQINRAQYIIDNMETKLAEKDLPEEDKTLLFY